MSEICIVNSLFPPSSFGGSEKYTQQIAIELARRSHNVCVLTTKPYSGLKSLTVESNKEKGIRIFRFFPANFSHRTNGTGNTKLCKVLWHQLDSINPHAVFEANRLLKRISPDIVHTNDLMGLSALLGRVAQRHASRHIHTLHSYSLLTPRRDDFVEEKNGRVKLSKNLPLAAKAYMYQKRLAIGRPDFVTAPSQHIIDLHKSFEFFNSIPSRRIFLGIDEEIAPSTEKKTDAAVLFVGKLLEQKGIGTYVEAAKLLPSVTFHICGIGPESEWVKQQSNKINNLRYHGYVTDRELADLRSQVAVAVVPSKSVDNSPYTIYESFAAGLPVIGSNIGGIPELVTPDKTGALFRPGASADMADTISKVMADTEHVQTMGKNAKRWIREHTLEKHVDQLVTDVYQIQ